MIRVASRIGERATVKPAGAAAGAPRLSSVLVLALVFLGAACGGRQSGESAKQKTAWELSRTANGGPVSLTVDVSKKEIGLADVLRVREWVRVQPGFTAELPDFAPEEFPGMGVTDVKDLPPRKRGKVTILTRRLTIEPHHSGTLTIPARQAWFSRSAGENPKTRAGGAGRKGASAKPETESGGESVVKTKPIDVKVDPIADAGAVKLPAPRSIMGPPPKKGGLSPWWAATLAVPLAGLVLVALRRRKKETAPRPPQEIAWEGLRRLAASGIAENGEWERFFVVLSAILREYIERRFAVRAPERTTEEFLAEVSRHESLRAHRSDLSSFLSLADQVKFARFTPIEENAEEAFDRVRSFVLATSSREESREGGGAERASRRVAETAGSAADA